MVFLFTSFDFFPLIFSEELSRKKLDGFVMRMLFKL